MSSRAWARPSRLPSGQDSSLDFLATSVNGEQSAKFIVTYTDGTAAQFTPALDDWTIDHGQTGEAVALSMPYRNPHQSIEVYLYSYSIPLNPAETVASITIPGGGNVELHRHRPCPRPPRHHAGELDRGL